MKATIYICGLIFLLTITASCSSEGSNVTATKEPSSDEEQAVQTVITFLKALHDGKYQEAADLYGGTYDIMIEQNPSTDPDDHAALLKNACTINGAQCLVIYSAQIESTIPDNEFWVKAELMNEDGSLFVLGPCCGGSETDFPPQSSFLFTVIRKSNGEFRVGDMPPYLP